MAKIAYGQDTIVAIATPFGEGAVGIVRLSGAQAVAIADKVFCAKNKKSLLDLKSFSMLYGWVKDNMGQVIDEVIVSVMRAPKSYTKEDVVEINSHGGAKALSSILGLVLSAGARLAQPGEFTKRAFLNGRIDLAQAEAVLDIIQAKSELALKVSMSQLSGEVSRVMSELRLGLLEILADMEAEIDFSEAAQPAGLTKDFAAAISAVLSKLQGLLDNSSRGRVIREGLKVVIFGRPNVGKSSLLNAILRQERAIVTPIAGTTRDTIEEFINIKGLAVRLIDTAGMLRYKDEIEKEALNRTQDAIKDADLILFVLDASSPVSEEDRALARKLELKNTITVLNKCDLDRRIDAGELRELAPGKSIEVSALEGRRIAELEGLIYESVFGACCDFSEGSMISNARHIEILKRSLQALEAAQDTLKKSIPLEFAVLDVKKSLEHIGELTGEVFSEDVLNAIFSKFCIGK